MIRQSTLNIEGQCPVSMWLSTALFLSASEMHQFLEALGPFFILQTDVVLDISDGIVDRQDFLKAYGQYVEDIKEGRGINEKNVKKYFQAVWTLSLDAVYSIRVPENRHIIKQVHPSIIVQHHKLHYSTDDHQFRSMVLGIDAFSFGIQLSYPQLYQDPKSMELKKILLDRSFYNTELYKKIKIWIRSNTRPISFLIDEKKVTIPVRIGKEVVSILNNHPGLIKNQLEVL
jgi:hypothetical protein